MQPIGDTIDPCPGQAGQMAMLECRLVLVSVLRFGGCILQRDESWRERGKEGEAIAPARANRLAGKKGASRYYPRQARARERTNDLRSVLMLRKIEQGALTNWSANNWCRDNAARVLWVHWSGQTVGKPTRLVVKPGRKSNCLCVFWHMFSERNRTGHNGQSTMATGLPGKAIPSLPSPCALSTSHGWLQKSWSIIWATRRVIIEARALQYLARRQKMRESVE